MRKTKPQPHTIGLTTDERRQRGSRRSRVSRRGSSTSLDRDTESPQSERHVKWTKSKPNQGNTIMFGRWSLLGLLFVLGTMASASDWILEFVTDEIVHGRELILDTNVSYNGRFCLWVLYTVVVVLIAMFATQWLSPYQANGKKRSAATGGIPELKTILSGSKLSAWLSLRMFAAKFFGMMLAASSGLLIGKEGPFVHMACIIGHQLIRLVVAYRVARMPEGTFQVGYLH